MRCRSCNVELNDFEATRKEVNTGAFVDLCNHCFHASDYTNIPVIERYDLIDGGDDEILE